MAPDNHATSASTAHRWGIRLPAALLCALVAGLIAAAGAMAAPPPNDNVSGAINNQNQRLFIATDEATVESGEFLAPASGQGCNGLDNVARAMDHTIWYRFTGTGGPVFIHTVDSDFDTMVAVYQGSPSASTFVGCNDDFSDQSLTSALSVPTTAGAVYLVQVGGCAPNQGCGNNASGSSVTTIIGNDDRAYAEPLGAGDPITRTNRFAATENGEPLTCQGVTYDNTTWFRFDIPAPAVGQAVFSATSTGFGPSIAVYRGGEAAPLACAVATNALVARTAVNLGPGSYFVQVGDATGGGGGTFNYQTEFAENLDRDGDGDANGTDCAPDDPNIAHGKPEIKGNPVDENCDGIAAPPDGDDDGVADANDRCPRTPTGGRDGNRDGCPDPRQFQTGSADADLRRVLNVGSGILVKRLRISAPSGARVIVKLGRKTLLDTRKRRRRARSAVIAKPASRGAASSARLARALARARADQSPAGAAPVSAHAARTILIRSLANRRLRRGAKLRIWITRAGYIGAYIEFRVRGGNARKTTRCLKPGSLKPARRCT